MKRSHFRIAGWIIVGLVAVTLVLAGGMKAFKLIPKEMVRDMNQKIHLDENDLQKIGICAIATGVLLFVPHTSSLGVLLASSYWGGAIMAHAAQDEWWLVPAALLALTWIGATLRDPAVMISFVRAWQKDAVAAEQKARQKE